MPCRGDAVYEHVMVALITLVAAVLLSKICCVAACFAECAACPKKVFPYCINHQSYGVRTFANCCFARCNGVVGDKDILYPGACKFTAACAACNAKQFAPVCCSNGKSYKNSCFATCNGASQCRPGHCSAGEQVTLLPAEHHHGQE